MAIINSTNLNNKMFKYRLRGIQINFEEHTLLCIGRAFKVRTNRKGQYIFSINVQIFVYSMIKWYIYIYSVRYIYILLHWFLDAIQKHYVPSTSIVILFTVFHHFWLSLLLSTSMFGTVCAKGVINWVEHFTNCFIMWNTLYTGFLKQALVLKILFVPCGSSKFATNGCLATFAPWLYVTIVE